MVGFVLFFRFVKMKLEVEIDDAVVHPVPFLANKSTDQSTVGFRNAEPFSSDLFYISNPVLSIPFPPFCF